MKPTVEILIGAPLSGNEAYVLRQLVADLQNALPALILANFEIPRQNASCQIDYVVVSPARTELVELKNFYGPLHGNENGRWMLTDPSGRQIPYESENPWQQARNAKLFLNDAMRAYQKKNPAVPPPRSGRFFEFDACVCIYPRIDPRSSLTAGNRKAWVRSYDALVAALHKDVLSASWSLQDWKAFAINFLRLTPVSLAGAIDPAVIQAENDLAAYLCRVKAIAAANLPPLLTAAGDEVCGAPLIAKLLGPNNHLLVGKSGAGKSFHMTHLVDRLAVSQEVPIEFRARHYSGDFPKAVERSSRARTPLPLQGLLDATRVAGLRPVFVVDNLHECNSAYLADLLKDLHAVQIATDARIVASSQSVPDNAGDIAFEISRISDLTMAHKRTIYSAYADVPESEGIDYLCAHFSNAYDISLAGKCHKDAGKSLTRYSLYKRYCARVLPKDAYSALTLFFRDCAAAMDAEVRYWLPKEHFDRLAKGFVKQSSLSFDLLGELSRCRLIKLDENGFEFEHDLLRDYFLSDYLVRKFDRLDTLAEQLARPKYTSLVDVVLARKTDENEIKTILRSAATMDVLSLGFRGYLGKPVQQVIDNDCQMLLDRALEDVPNLRVVYNKPKDQERPTLFTLTIVGNRPWTTYDLLLTELAAQNLDATPLQNKVLTLLDRTEDSLHAIVVEDCRRENMNSKPVWSELVRIYGLLQHPSMTVPLFMLLLFLRHSFMFPGRRSLDAAFRNALLMRIDRELPSAFSLLLLLESVSTGPRDIDFTIKLLLAGWNSRLPVLRMEAVQMIHDQAHWIREGHPDGAKAIGDYLEQMQSKDLFLGSTIAEALAIYGRLHLDLTAEDTLNEMKELIHDSWHPAEATPQISLSDRAYSLIDRMFEDVFQGLYVEAYNLLERAERVQLLRLAASSPTVGFFTCWVLQELMHLQAKEAESVFKSFASHVDATASSAQEAAGAFVLGIRACAKFRFTREPVTDFASADDLAWELLGQLLLATWTGRDHGTDSEVDPLWSRLLAEAPLAAADVLYHIERPHSMLEDELRDFSLLKQFPTQVCQILDSSLRQRASLTSLFNWGGACDHSLIQFAIRTLGELGSVANLPTLNSIADDKAFGKDAVAAIARIQTRLRSMQD